MKKITNLLYVLAVLMLVSCNDFLDKSPKYAVDPETTVTDDVAVALTYRHPTLSRRAIMGWLCICGVLRG